MNHIIIWLRRDLRIENNPALAWAGEQGQNLLPVYIHAPDEEAPWQPGGASRWWLHNSLQQFESTLAGLGLKLHYFCGNTIEILRKLIEESGAHTLVFNRLYEPSLFERDNKIIRLLEQDGVQVRTFDSGLLFRPGSLLNNQQLPYRVYTPFARKVRQHLQLKGTRPEYRLPTNKPHCTAIIRDDGLDALKLLDKNTWHHKLHRYWQPGEERAQTLLENFLDQKIETYEKQRDLPAIDATSALSPHLHFGEITVEQIYNALQPFLDGQAGHPKAASAERFLNQLIWREFAHHILWHFPHTHSLSMDARYNEEFWQQDERKIQTWQHGETGIPIIDAGMKQLWETGWMHNRVRMIVASFLCKNMGQHWIEGARWFWDTLVDADLANNSMGWQWVAGCGVDAAPYYRIFNPLTQTSRFDNKLEYIQRWRPEARDINYLPPIIDLDASRKLALEHYRTFISFNG